MLDIVFDFGSLSLALQAAPTCQARNSEARLWDALAEFSLWHRDAPRFVAARFRRVG